MAAAMLPHLYDGDESQGWSAGMRTVTHALLASVTLPPGPILEIGCGGGQLLAELQSAHPDRTVCGVDLHPLALAHAALRQGPHAVLSQAVLPQLPWATNTFALVLGLDVFDQQGVSLAAALAESYRVLRPGGALLLRVSAHPWLYGAHDVAFHTGRRYTCAEVSAALGDNGLELHRITYANAGLALPVGVLRLAQRWGILPWQPSIYGRDGLHQVAAWALAEEAAWLRHADLSLGLSLCAVARQTGQVDVMDTDALDKQPTLPSALVCTVLPTYNERDNIGPLIEGILAHAITPHLVLVVDDNSPDGTWQVVEEMAARHNTPERLRIALIRRIGEKGLTSAIQRGIDAAIHEHGAEIVTWMDCDLSMPPADVPRLVQTVLDGADVAIGSRWIPGGADVAHGFMARSLSWTINAFARVVISPTVHDYTSGFVVARAPVLQSIRLVGDYGEYCIDLLGRALRQGYVVREVPYHCVPRTTGESKTGANLWDYLVKGRKYVTTIWRLRA